MQNKISINLIKARVKFLCFGIFLGAFACQASTAQVVVKDAWVRTTVPQQNATGAFMQLRATRTVSLIKVTSPSADNVEIHSMEMQGDVMKMRAVNVVELPAGKTVEFKSGGYHIMLFKLKAQIKSGEVISLVMTVEDKNKKREFIHIQAIAKATN